MTANVQSQWFLIHIALHKPYFFYTDQIQYEKAIIFNIIYWVFFAGFCLQKKKTTKNPHVSPSPLGLRYRGNLLSK